MKVLLFFAALCAILCVSQAQLPCDNPFYRLLANRDWQFSYRAFAALQRVESNICPGFVNTNSCCDGIVYDALAIGWLKLYNEVIGVRIKIEILQIEVDILLAEIANAKVRVNNNPDLTPAQKSAITDFLDAISNAVSQLVPNLLNNFDNCYSTVLKFYAGMLCKACDPNWRTWVNHFNNDTFELIFAVQTCNNFQEACAPFFAPFFNYAKALFNALETLAQKIPDNATRQAVLDGLEAYEPPCLDNNDCLKYICYRFLRGLDRLEDWVEDSFKNRTSGGGGRRSSGILSDRAIESMNRVQRMAVAAAVPRAGSDLTGTQYTGSFDPTSQPTSLNTNSGTNGAETMRAFWADISAFEALLG